MSDTRTDFEAWLASFPEEKLKTALDEYSNLAEEYANRADETRALIALRRRLLTQTEKPSANGSGPEMDDQLFKVVSQPRRPSLAAAVYQVVDQLNDNEPTAREILEALDAVGWGPQGKTPINSIHATASRLVRDGVLVRTERGYRLAEE